MKAIRRLTALLLAVVFIQPLAVRAAPDDLAIAREALTILKDRHWNPHLDIPALIRAGVGGLRRALARKEIDASSIDEIQSGLDERSTLDAFGDRLNTAVRLARGRLQERDLLYAGLRAIATAVGGSHTSFLDPQQRTVFQAILEGTAYSGIGVTYGKLDDQWVLSSVVPRSPAERAGVLRGDVVVRIDDLAAGDMDSSELQSHFLGDSGTTVQLTLRRGSMELTTSIVRAGIIRPVAESQMFDGIGYLKLYGYPRGAATVIREELTRVLAAHPRALIVDLRENGGGLIQEFIDTMGLFLPPDTLIFREVRRDGVARTGRTVGTPLVPPLPLIALIDLGTASNGELTAAALRDYAGATLVGMRTAGALEYSDLARLSDGSGLRFSYARVLTGKNVELEGRGYPPDIIVGFDPRTVRDLQLERAVHELFRHLSGRRFTEWWAASLVRGARYRTRTYVVDFVGRGAFGRGMG